MTDFRSVLILRDDIRLPIGLFGCSDLLNSFESIFKRLILRMEEKVVLLLCILSGRDFVGLIRLDVISIRFVGRLGNIGLMRV